MIGWLVGSALAAQVLVAHPGNGVKEVTFDVGGLIQPRFDLAGTPLAPSFGVDRIRLDLGGSIVPERGPLLIQERLVVEFLEPTHLLDAWVQVGPKPLALRVGQMKTPFARGGSTPDAKSLLPWGTVQSGWVTKRDVGAMVTGGLGAKGYFEYQLGAFDGEGPNVLKNANPALLYVARAVVTPTGGPGTRSELMHEWAPPDGDPRPIVSFGLAAHRNVTGEDGARVGALGLNAELFVHDRLVTGQAEAMERVIESEDPAAGDYKQLGAYAQIGVFIPATWARDHLAVLARFEQGDPFVADAVPDGLAVAPAVRRETIAIGLFAASPLFKDVNDAKVTIGYRASQELEGDPIADDQFSIAGNLSF